MELSDIYRGEDREVVEWLKEAVSGTFGEVAPIQLDPALVQEIIRDMQAKHGGGSQQEQQAQHPPKEQGPTRESIIRRRVEEELSERDEL